MTPAAVGFQCPDDVRAGAASAPTPRSALGTSLRSAGAGVGSGERGTRSLLAVQLVAALVAQALGSSLVLAVGLVSVGLSGGRLVGVGTGEVWRLLTSALVPAGAAAPLSTALLSLVFALLITWFLGRALEADLGPARLLAVWTASAVAGSAATVAVLSPGAITYGGSGAAFGLLAATLVVGRRFGRPVGGLLVLGVLWVALTALRGGGDWSGAIAGAAVGAALAAVAAYLPRQRRTPAFWGLAGAVVVVSAAAAYLLARA